MPNVVAYPALGRRASPRTILTVSPLLAEIVDALVYFRGQAHRDAVCDRIASRRAGEPATATDSLRREVFATFEDHLNQVAGCERRHSLMRLSFGEGSHRWSLSEDGRRLFDTPETPDRAAGRRADKTDA